MQGDADAQYQLAESYFNGDVTEKDAAEGLRWLRLAAAQGHDEAELRLGYCYFDGEGVERDKAEAERWLGLAEAHGNEEAAAVLEDLDELWARWEKGEDGEAED